MPSSLRDGLQSLGIPYLEGVPLSARTTLRVGGPAAFWVDARGAEDIRGAMGVAAEAGVPVQVIGNGSNLLVRDGGIDGLVLCVGDGMNAVAIDGHTLHAQAGARLTQVAQAAQAAGLAGLEAVSGIPGAIGGAVCMNAGAYGVEIAQRLLRVELLDETGALRDMMPDELAFGYRTSLLMQRGWIAVSATLSLMPGDPEAIRAEMRHYAAQRRARQPLSLPSAGSFFKRPPGQFAGVLIEQAGLKGLRVGGAQVSELHAGFLVNTGGATAKDFLDLMEQIQARVQAHCGVRLEPEVRILGCDSSY